MSDAIDSELLDNQIAKLFNSEKLRVEDIADQLGVPKFMVSGRIVTMQSGGYLKKKPRGSTKFKSLESVKRAKSLEDMQKEELELRIIEFRKKGITVKKMSVLLELSVSKIDSVIKKLITDGKVKSKFPSRRYVCESTSTAKAKADKLHGEIIEWYNSELFSIAEIAEAVGISVGKANRTIKYLRDKGILNKKTTQGKLINTLPNNDREVSSLEKELLKDDDVINVEEVINEIDEMVKIQEDEDCSITPQQKDKIITAITKGIEALTTLIEKDNK